MENRYLRALAAGLLGSTGLVATSHSAIAQEKEPLFYYGVTVEQLEYRIGRNSDVYAWDGDALAGTDDLKLRLQSKGEYEKDSSAFETLENQLLLQTPISTFFDAKAGVRYDMPRGYDRLYGVLGVQGLAPQWFEIDADLFLSEKGDVSARLDAEYELLITNRIILTPAAEIDFAFSEDTEAEVGAGLSTAELGLRLSYDLIDRAVSPYVGVHYERAFGDTASFRRADGADVDELFLVIGTRLLF
ncbi:MAG: copper resistance protein B [Sneathiellaceae bacterium]